MLKTKDTVISPTAPYPQKSTIKLTPTLTIVEKTLRLFENINLFSESKNNKNLGLKKLLVKISFNKELKRKAESTINSSMTSYDFLKLQRTVDGNKVRVYSENGLNLFEPSSREKVKSLKQE